MNKKIMIKLATPVANVVIGEINLETEVINAFGYTMRDNHIELNGKHVSCDNWGSAKVICEGWVYMYHVNIYDTETQIDEHLFYYVETGQLYDDNGYLSEVIVGEKLETDDGIQAQRLFCDRVCEVLEMG